MSFEGVQALAGGEVPEPQGFVVGGGDGASVGQRHDVGDGRGMSFEDSQALSEASPQSRWVLSSEAEIAHPSGSAARWLTLPECPLGDAQGLSGGEVPEPQGVVP